MLTVLAAGSLAVTILTANQEREQWAAVTSLSVAALISMRLVFGQLGAHVTMDVLHHMNSDLSDLKDNLRSCWTGSALVLALFASVCTSMLFETAGTECDDPMPFVYFCMCLVALFLAFQGVMQATFALMYTDHLSTADRVNFISAYPWSISNPMLAIAICFIWMLSATSVLAACTHGTPGLVFSLAFELYTMWSAFSAVSAFSRWQPGYVPCHQVTQSAFFHRLQSPGLTNQEGGTRAATAAAAETSSTVGNHAIKC